MTVPDLLRTIFCRIALTASLALGLGQAALAQDAAEGQPAEESQGLGAQLGGDDEPIAIDASESLEWMSEEQLYVARGDARMRQGDTEIQADVLTASYRELPDGGTEIYRATAEGNVVITTPTETVTGDHGIYDLDENKFVLTGDDLRLETPTETITARDSLEYWQADQLAIARGDAVAIRPNESGGQDRIEADVLTAEFVEGEDGSLVIDVVNAEGNVVITTATDVARGSEGVYDVTEQIATLSGDVRLTRGDNQLNGERAEVDLETGVSRLLAGSDGRVRGLLVPSDGEGEGEGEGQEAQ